MQPTKVKGSIWSIPIFKIDSKFKSFPRPADSNVVIIVKLEKKGNKGDAHLKRFISRIKESPLIYLKVNNHLYQDIKN